MTNAADSSAWRANSPADNSLPCSFDTVTPAASRSDEPPLGNPAPAPVLTAVWCCSVGTTWVLELRELDRDARLGPIVDWISSGVPVTEPKPDALTKDLLTTRGLHFFLDPSTDPHIGTRHRIGYACADAELITLAHLVRDHPAKTEPHPVLLAASWIAAGFSANTAVRWIHAGCLPPNNPAAAATPEPKATRSVREAEHRVTGKR